MSQEIIEKIKQAIEGYKDSAEWEEIGRISEVEETDTDDIEVAAVGYAASSAHNFERTRGLTTHLREVCGPAARAGRIVSIPHPRSADVGRDRTFAHTSWFLRRPARVRSPARAPASADTTSSLPWCAPGAIALASPCDARASKSH